VLVRLRLAKPTPLVLTTLYEVEWFVCNACHHEHGFSSSVPVCARCRSDLYRRPSDIALVIAQFPGSKSAGINCPSLRAPCGIGAVSFAPCGRSTIRIAQRWIGSNIEGRDSTEERLESGVGCGTHRCARERILPICAKVERTVDLNPSCVNPNFRRCQLQSDKRSYACRETKKMLAIHP